MSLISYYTNKYLNLVKSKYGDKIYAVIHFDGRCQIISETDDKVLFECNSFTELMDKITG